MKNIRLFLVSLVLAGSTLVQSASRSVGRIADNPNFAGVANTLEMLMNAKVVAEEEKRMEEDLKRKIYLEELQALSDRLHKRHEERNKISKQSKEKLVAHLKTAIEKIQALHNAEEIAEKKAYIQYFWGYLYNLYTTLNQELQGAVQVAVQAEAAADAVAQEAALEEVLEN